MSGKPYAEVIGDPIAQSKSPAIHRFWLAETGIDADYRHAHVRLADLPDYLAERRADPLWRGCNVTMPHKLAVMPLLDRIEPLAIAVGAVNTVVREEDGSLTGTNTDVAGFLEPLAGRTFGAVTVVGAGGAARAILHGLASVDAGPVTLLNRDVAKAAALLAEFGLAGQALPLDATPPPADLLVNSSSLGMVGHPPLPRPLPVVCPGGLVYDIVTAPLDTELLRESRAMGLDTVDGLEMLIGQADHAFARFFGPRPPRTRDAALRALLMAPA